MSHASRARIVFYVRANSKLGFGHLSRAVSLAQACASRGWISRFYSEDDLNVARFFKSVPFRFTRLRRRSILGAELRRDGVETLVVDVPRRDERILGEWGEAVRRLVVIDDWDVDCPPAHVLVNGHVLWADRLVRKRRQILLTGLRYALLKPQWVRARSQYRLRRKVQRVLVTFGGSDPDDMAGRLVPKLARRFPGVTFFSVLGPGYRGRLESGRNLPGNVEVVHNAVSLAPIVLRVDAAVSAVGVTMYELASTGVPAVLVDPAPDHAIFMDAMENQGLALCAPDEDAVPDRLGELVRSSALRREISRSGRRRLDGRGVERVAEHLETSIGEVGHA